MTRNETIELLQLLVAAYPSGKLVANSLTVGIWHDMLKDLPGELVGAAVRRMIATLKFPPSIADVRSAVANGLADARGAVDAGEAWRRVRKAITWYGYYREADAREALGSDIWAGVEMAGGWQYLCMDDGEEGVRSAQFERRYAARSAAQVERAQIPQDVDDRFRELVGGLTEQITAGPAGLMTAAAKAIERRGEEWDARVRSYDEIAVRKRNKEMERFLLGEGESE